MAMTAFMNSLRLDLGDTGSERFSDTVLQRCIEKSIPTLNRDLGLSVALTGGEMVPEPEGQEKEMLLLLAAISACQVARAIGSASVKFSSGDKSVDKSRQASDWAAFEQDLKKQYREMLRAINPDGYLDDNSFWTACGPVVYERGSEEAPCPY